MYDDLTEGELPDPEDEEAQEVYYDVLDIMSARAATHTRAKQLRDVLRNPHIQVHIIYLNFESNKGCSG